MNLKRIIPGIVIIMLVGLNILAFQMSKNYFTRTGDDQEVEELSDSEQGEINDNKILVWTYEFFKSFKTNPR